MARGPDKQFDRQEVLQKAMQAFWAHGYERTGLSDLTREMGIGRQSLYDTFGDKRSLYLEALALYFQAGIEPVLTALRTPGPGLDAIKKVFRYWEEMASSGQAQGCMLGNSMAEFGHDDPEVRALLARYVSRVQDAFKAALERAREDGSLKSRLPVQDLADLMLTTSQGGALMSRIHPDRQAARRVLAALTHLLETP